MNPFVAEIRMLACNFAPQGWAMCNGQLLPISQNTALFSLLGTFYGGDGKSTFALPNLQGSVPIGEGQGPGLSSHFLGEQGGQSSVTLIASEIPFHNHQFNASTTTGSTVSAAGNHLGTIAGGGTKQNKTSAKLYSPNPGQATTALAPQAISVAGASQPHNNMMPYVALNFCIALVGVFPPRT